MCDVQEPKIIEQGKAAEQFKEANEKVDALNKKVEAMVAKVNAVKAGLTNAEMASAQIKEEAKRLEKRMKLALRLVNGLEEHQKRSVPLLFLALFLKLVLVC